MVEIPLSFFVCKNIYSIYIKYCINHQLVRYLTRTERGFMFFVEVFIGTALLLLSFIIGIISFIFVLAGGLIILIAPIFALYVLYDVTFNASDTVYGIKIKKNMLDYDIDDINNNIDGMDNDPIPNDEQIYSLINSFDVDKYYQEDQIKNSYKLIKKYGIIGYIAYKVYNEIDILGISYFTADEYNGYIKRFCKQFINNFHTRINSNPGEYYNKYLDIFYIEECVRRSFPITFFEKNNHHPNREQLMVIINDLVELFDKEFKNLYEKHPSVFIWKDEE